MFVLIEHFSNWMFLPLFLNIYWCISLLISVYFIVNNKRVSLFGMSNAGSTLVIYMF